MTGKPASYLKQSVPFVRLGLAVAIILIIVTDSGQTKNFYFGFGPGYSVLSGEIEGDRLAISINGTYGKQRWQISARYVECLDWHLNIGLSGGGSKVVDLAREVALLGGVHAWTDSNISITFEAGIGRVSGYSDRSILDSSGYPIGRASFSTGGLALQSQMYYRRIGLVLFGNINSKQSFAGLLICFRIGTYWRGK